MLSAYRMSLPDDQRSPWSESEMIKFIDTYKTMPELWDQSSFYYKERSMKVKAFKKLASIFNTDIQDMRRRVHNLRCQFTTELRRLKYKAVRLNVHASEVRSDWKYFEKLNYLLVNYKEFHKDDSGFTAKTEYDGTTDASNHSTEYSRMFSQSDDEKNETDIVCSPSLAKRMTHKAQEDYIPENNYQVNIAKKRKMSDEDHRIFGEYVASELRNVSEIGAKKLKMKIRKAILQVTEEEFDMENEVEYLEINDQFD